MSERFREAFRQGDGQTVQAACVENDAAWVLYSEGGFAPGDVITRVRDGAVAIVQECRTETPEDAVLQLIRQTAERIRGR